MSEYKRICEKLGFTMEDYSKVRSTLGDDNNPFRILTDSESDYLIEYCKKNNITG